MDLMYNVHTEYLLYITHFAKEPFRCVPRKACMTGVRVEEWDGEAQVRSGFGLPSDGKRVTRWRVAVGSPGPKGIPGTVYRAAGKENWHPLQRVSLHELNELTRRVKLVG
eukprot:7565070-Pyramimonas_sp.AAC.1